MYHYYQLQLVMTDPINKLSCNTSINNINDNNNKNYNNHDNKCMVLKLYHYNSRTSYIHDNYQYYYCHYHTSRLQKYTTNNQDILLIIILKIINKI